MWIDLDGVANLRDVGGLPTVDGGKIIPGRLLRSDNLQTLTPGDVDQLLGMGLTDVVDLRSDYEAEREGPGPLSRTAVRGHQYSLFREWREGVGEAKPDVRPEVLPGQTSTRAGRGSPLSSSFRRSGVRMNTSRTSPGGWPKPAISPSWRSPIPASVT